VGAEGRALRQSRGTTRAPHVLPMKVLVYSSFDDVAIEHRSAFSYPCQPNFLLSYDWFEVLYSTSLQPAWRPRIYVVCAHDGAPQAALFCCTKSESEARTLCSMTNFYAIEYSVSFANGAADRNAALAALLECIATERPRWHSVRLRLLKDSDPVSQAAAEGLSAKRFTTSRYFQYENWFLPVEGSFDEYYARRSSQVRNTIERKSKKLRKTHATEIVVHRSVGQALDAAISGFETIYNASWKQPEPHVTFIPALTRRAAELGILRLGLLRVDGQPAAAQLWLTCAGRAIIYKLAYDERFADLGVGSILSKELFRGAIDDDHVQEIDYGVGSESYKKDWMTACRRLEGLEAHNLHTLLGLSLSLTDASMSRLRHVRSALARLTSPADGR